MSNSLLALKFNKIMAEAQHFSDWSNHQSSAYKSSTVLNQHEGTEKRRDETSEFVESKFICVRDSVEVSRELPASFLFLFRILSVQRKDKKIERKEEEKSSAEIESNYW